MKYVVAIRREQKSVWERRVALAPIHVRELMNENPDIEFIVQPSKKRIFTDDEYEEAGATIKEDISEASLILGVKEIPLDKFIPDKTFLFFSHTFKAQPHNMPALDKINELNIRLMDYEKITDEKGQRLIAFGRYAGIAGALDFLKGFGEYIMQMGISTPFLNCNQAYKYFDIEDAYTQLKKVGELIQKKTVPKELRPMIFGVTGTGRTAQGCLEVINNLPVKEVAPSQLEALCSNPDDPAHKDTIYIVNIDSKDTIEPKDPSKKFDKQDYYKNPDKYKSVFKDKFLPYLSALFHCIYWDTQYPVYIKNQDLKELAEKKKLRLLGVCDVTCDIEGSIECLREYTQPDQPFFFYNSLKDEETFDGKYEESKLVYLAVDFLPCELAMDASMHFSKLLKGWIPNIVKSDKNKPVPEQGLIPELERCVETTNGKLAPKFEYITELRAKNEKEEKEKENKKKENPGLEKVEKEAKTLDSLHENVEKVKPKQENKKTLDFS